MGDLTRNLSRSEFVCVCGCGFDTIDFILVMALQGCVKAMSRRHKSACTITITGGNRCLRHNTALRDLFKKTGGAKGANASLISQHIFGRAADFKIFLARNENGVKYQINPEEIAFWFDENYPRFGIGRYHNRTHVDSRTNGPARWDTRN